jgi:hypothetical protein
MRTLVLLALLANLTVTAALPAQQIHPDEIKLKPRIDQAIGAGVETLFDAQLRDGSWGVAGDHVGGQTALCAYALLKCGVPISHPALQRAFEFLDGITPNRTYSVGCMLLAYGATTDPNHKPRMRELLAIMVRFQHKHGTYGYPHSAPDLSNTQYAALGLWAANKAGLKVAPQVWNDLANGTIAHQEAFHMAKVGITNRTGTAQREIAGFQYRASGSKTANNATGTMTTAGVSILRICEIGLGKKLRGKARKEFTRAMEAGLSWLDINFSVKRDQKPQGRGGKWLLYYLYGMERVGGLTRREQFGEHWWYVEGAKEVLSRQKKGRWGQPYDTCFALLFLRRATITGPMTGAGAGAGNTRHLFAAGESGDDIELRAAGQQPLILYIQNFGKFLLDEHSEYGLRILRVEYLMGDQVFGQLAADPTKAWTSLETFIHRHPALPHGVHTLKVRVIAIAANAPPGEIDKTITLESKPMDVKIRDVIEPWMKGLAQIQKGNQITGQKFKATASSLPKNAAKAADGLNHTHWLCDPKDQSPTLTLTFDDAIKTRWLILTQPLQKRDDIKRMGLIRQVEVSCNGKKPFKVDMHANPLAATEFKLPKTQRVRTVTLKVVGRGGKPELPVGFAEVVLEGKRK